jgi:hypothetical protein
MNNGIKKYLFLPKRILKAACAKGYFNYLSDRRYIKLVYWLRMNKTLHLDTPQTFNEKLQWLKLHDRKPEYTMMADKYLVREYIAKQLGEEYLIPLIGVWDDPDEIDFDALPNQFVLKCNHNSGLGMCICKDKSQLNIDKAKSELRKGLEQDYYLTGREWPYKDIPRKIIAEKYMVDAQTAELRDYKFFCFNGKVKCFKIDFDRFINHQANYYDANGVLLPFGEVVCPPDFDRTLEMPHNLRLMIRLAEKLADGIPYVRVDFYEVDAKVYFGEITFFPASGFGPFTPEEWDYKLGEWIKLPDKN